MARLVHEFGAVAARGEEPPEQITIVYDNGLEMIPFSSDEAVERIGVFCRLSSTES